MPHPWPDCLTEPAAYLTALERLLSRLHRRRTLAFTVGGERTLALIAAEPAAFCRLLAREVRAGSFAPGTVDVGRVRVGDRWRALCRFTLPDLLVHAVAANGLSARLEAQLSPHLYSYRAGRSAAQAARALARGVQRHRRGQPDPRRRGLYVLRRDVRAFGDSIPVYDGAPLWPRLHRLAGGGEGGDRVGQLLRALVRPVRRGGDGEQDQRPRYGLPTGSPLQTVVANLYLSPLDELLGAIPGGCYARYGDDFVFAHPDPDVATDARAAIDRLLGELGLEVNRGKAREIFLNAAGRPYSGAGPWRGSARVELLGYAVSGAGLISPKGEKTRRFLREVRRRAANAVHAVGSADPATAGRAVCGAISRSLDTSDPLACRDAFFLGGATDDRGMLRMLDHAVALTAAEVLSGIRGVRAFRHVSPRTLRREYGLLSLEERRNRRRDRRRS